MAEKLISKIPEGALADKWTNHKAHIRVVSPANKRKLDIIVIGILLIVSLLSVFLINFSNNKNNNVNFIFICSIFMILRNAQYSQHRATSI